MAATRKSRPLGLRIGLVVFALACAGFFVANHRLGPKHLFPVVPGVLYRSGTLPPEQLNLVVERYGIRTVVNLRAEVENSEGTWHARQSATLQDLGVAMVDLPMHSGWPAAEPELERWVELINDPSAQPILVHCQHGVVRTGIMVAIYKIERLGYSGAESIQHFQFFGDGLPEPIGSRVWEYLGDYERRRDDELVRSD